MLAAAGVHMHTMYVSETIPAGRPDFRIYPAFGRLGREAESKAQRKQDGKCGREGGKKDVEHFCPFCLHHVFCLCAREGV